MRDQEDCTTIPFISPTHPLLDSREALHALLLARLHDALRTLDGWLIEYAKHGFIGLTGRLPDGRPYRVGRSGHDAGVWVFPDDASLEAYDACELRRPFLSRNLRYLHAAQSTPGALEPEARDALEAMGCDVDVEGGVIVRRCVAYGESARVRPVDLLDVMHVLGHLLARRQLQRAA